jgi:hypothetical protein
LTIDAAVHDAPRTATLFIPTSCNATQDVDVTVASNNPAVATVNGQTSTVVHFTAGGATSAPLSIGFGAVGVAQLTLSATGGCSVEAGLTVTVHAPESIALQTTYDLMKVGQSQQATAIANFGPAGTRNVTASSNGTTYSAVPGGIVTVSADGQITAVGLGTVTVTATYEGTTSSGRTIKVIMPNASGIKIAGSGILLVDLNAADATAGQATWVNKGSLGDFTKVGAPVLGDVADQLAVSFDGINDAYQGPLSPDELRGGAGTVRTIEVWAYNPSFGGLDTMVAWGNRAGGCGSNMAFAFGDHADWGALPNAWAPNCGQADTGWGILPPPSMWRHLVYTWDSNDGGGTARLYDNGVEVNSEVTGLLTAGGGYINLAAQNSSANPLSLTERGALSLAAVRVHDGALTAADVAFNYNAGPAAGMIPPDLNADTHVDGMDVLIFNQCAGGPEVALTGECASVDFDFDGDGDQDDFAIFQRCYTGPVDVASPDCVR